MKNAVFYLNALLATEQDAITIVNTEMEVIFWNEVAEKTYNIKKSDILNRKITEFFYNDDLMVLKVLKSKKPVKNTYHRPRKDKHVIINTSPIFNDVGNLIGAVSVERDMTQMVKLNHHLVTTSKELNELRQKLYIKNKENPFAKLIGKSQALTRTIQVAERAAKSDATMLILGESGTGKEVCARAIHESSSRKNGPFIPVNCGAIPSALFESELFGYEKGAFTGAERNGKEGKIEMADGGTLFLDEIGELPLDMQVKLLRVLQENVIYRIGDTKGRKVNVRFIAATNQNLQHLIWEKKFRADLFYRLNVIQVTMPPLRERIEDIYDLVSFFLKQLSNQYEMPIPRFEKDAYDVLMKYDWPGNVRELRNLCERIVILSDKLTITSEDLRSFLLHPYPSQSIFVLNENPRFLSNKRETLEKRLIEETMKEVNGNKSKAAEKLGISRATLYSKLKKYRLDEM